jgi:hypothetical protein
MPALPKMLSMSPWRRSIWPTIPVAAEARIAGPALVAAAAGPPPSAASTILVMAQGSPSGFSLTQKVPILTQALQADQGGSGTFSLSKLSAHLSSIAPLLHLACPNAQMPLAAPLRRANQDHAQGLE